MLHATHAINDANNIIIMHEEILPLSWGLFPLGICVYGQLWIWRWTVLLIEAPNNACCDPDTHIAIQVMPPVRLTFANYA